MFLEGWADLGMHWNAWIAEVEQARASFAALIGAPPSETKVGTSVSACGSAIRLAPHGFPYEEEMEQALRTVAHLMHEH